jgi:hypothetical protein
VAAGFTGNVALMSQEFRLTGKLAVTGRWPLKLGLK